MGKREEKERIGKLDDKIISHKLTAGHKKLAFGKALKLEKEAKS